MTKISYILSEHLSVGQVSWDVVRLLGQGRLVPPLSLPGVVDRVEGFTQKIEDSLLRAEPDLSASVLSLQQNVDGFRRTGHLQENPASVEQCRNLKQIGAAVKNWLNSQAF